MAKRKARASAEAPADGAPSTEAPPAPERERSEFDLGGKPDLGHSRLAALGDKLQGAWGGRVMLPLSNAPGAIVRRVPFGILVLDWKTRGGLVVGRFNRLWGAKSTLKSTLCLRALRQAQRLCRHCKHTLVRAPGTDRVNCRCPPHRFWLDNPDDLGWLSGDAAVKIVHGELPDGAVMKNMKGRGRVPVLTCEPSDRLKADAKAAAKAAKEAGRPAAEAKALAKAAAREIVFTETYRCEPMRALFLDSEGTIDAAWAIANGVDTRNVQLVGARWAEQNLAALEEGILSRETDFIVIDSTSVLETAENMAKSLDERAVVASRANMMGRFVRRLLNSSAEDGLAARFRPTVLCTSQVTTKGIGLHGIPPWLGPTDGNTWDHALSLDIKMTEKGYTFDDAGTRARFGAFEFEVVKNKAGGSPKSTGLIRFWVTPEPGHAVGDSDDLATVMNYARQMGEGFILDGSGSAVLMLFSPHVPEGRMKFGTVGECSAFLAENPTVYDDLRACVLERLIATSDSIVTAGGVTA